MALTLPDALQRFVMLARHLGELAAPENRSPIFGGRCFADVSYPRPNPAGAVALAGGSTAVDTCGYRGFYRGEVDFDGAEVHKVLSFCLR